MLFHDIAKPVSYTEVDSVGHFYGHPQISSDMATEILLRLKYDNDTIEAVTQLILYHDTDIQPRRKHIKRWLNRIGEERFRQLLIIRKADAMAQSEEYRQEKLDALKLTLPILDDIIEQQQCFSLKDLAINGRDLIAIGVPEGVTIGVILNKLLDAVINEAVVNEKNHLIQEAYKWKNISNAYPLEHFEKVSRACVRNYTNEEWNALSEKLHNPDNEVYCPRCDNEIECEEIGNSISVHCISEDCIFGGIRGL